jgi:hypothetical protein
MAIDMWLTLPQQIEVRSVQNIDEAAHRQVPSGV